MLNVFVTNAAISQALRVACAGLAKSEEGKSVEVSGLLLGRDLVGDLLVTSAISGTQVSSELGCQLDENFLASVAYKILANKTSERIVGMFHSHQIGRASCRERV